MYSDKLNRARINLIVGGIKPKYVRRTIAELQDHHEDLKSNLLQQGMPASEAEVQAESLMGDPDLVVREALNKPELRSLVSAYPKTTFLALPVFAFIVAIISWIALMVGFVQLITIMGENETITYPTPFWFVLFMQIMEFLLNYGLAIILAVVFMMQARERHIPNGLLPSCIIILAFLGSLALVNIGVPQAVDESGTIRVTLSFFGFVPGPNIFRLSYLWSALIKISVTGGVAALIWWHLQKNEDKRLVV